MCGFVPVAPVSTNKFSREEYESVGVPTLIVVGEKDTGLGRTSTKHLSQIPSASRVQVGSDYSCIDRRAVQGSAKSWSPGRANAASKARAVLRTAFCPSPVRK